MKTTKGKEIKKMTNYILLVKLSTQVMAVTSNIKVDSENNLYTDLDHDLRKAVVFTDNGQALKNVKQTLKYNPNHKVIKIALD